MEKHTSFLSLEVVPRAARSFQIAPAAFCWACAWLCLTAAHASAYAGAETSGGRDRSFVTGYSQRLFADTYHREEVYGPAVEGPEGADAWKWQRDFVFSTDYESNLFNDANDVRHDLIYTYAPRVGVIRRERNGFLQLFYRMMYQDYVVYEKESFASHEQTTTVGYKIGRMTMNASNRFVPSRRYAVGDRGELATPGRSYVSAMSNSAVLDTKFEISPKTRISFIAAHDVLEIPRSSNSASATSFGHQQYTLTPGLYYQLFPKTTLNTEYRYSIVDTNKSNFDAATHLVSVGLKGRLTAKTNISLSTGLQRRVFEDNAIPDADGFVLRLGLSTRLSPKVTLTLSTVHDIEDNFDSGDRESLQSELDTYAFNLTWRATSHTSLDLRGSVTFNEDDKFVTLLDRENDTLTHTRKREDITYSWGISWRWRPRDWVSVLLGYDYLNRNSSFKNFEYEDHHVTGSVAAKF